jgi:hypothetical protein
MREEGEEGRSEEGRGEVLEERRRGGQILFLKVRRAEGEEERK